jgi:hypothetical protein
MNIITEEHETEEETFPLSLVMNDQFAQMEYEEDPLALPEVKNEFKVSCASGYLHFATVLELGKMD